MVRIQLSESCVQGSLSDSRHLGQDYDVEKVQGVVFGTPALLGVVIVVAAIPCSSQTLSCLFYSQTRGAAEMDIVPEFVSCRSS